MALVGTEVRQHQERAAENARPERVCLRQVERKVEHPQTARRSGNGERIVQWYGHAHNEYDDHGKQRTDHDIHLFYVGPRDRLRAAQHGVDHGRNADQRHAPPDIPAKDGGQHHAGGGDDRTA